MTKQEKNNYNSMQVKAVYSCGLCGIEILEVLHGINDYVVYRFTGDNTLHRVKIHYGVNKTTFKSVIGNIDFNNCLRCF